MRIVRSIPIILLLLFTALCAQQDSGNQGFYRSEGLALFNEGKYDQAIDLLKQRADRYESQKGIAYYYLGESFYNKGLTASSAAVSMFQNAAAYFEQSVSQSGMISEYPGLRLQAVYKNAWSLYRIAEQTAKPMSALEDARKAFEKAKDECSDSLKFQSEYMEAECRIRYAGHLSKRVLLSTNKGYQRTNTKKIITYLDEAAALYAGVYARTAVSPQLKAAAGLRLQDTYIAKGMLYDNMPADVYRDIKSGSDPADRIDAAGQWLEKADYDALKTGLAPSITAELENILVYSNALKNLNLYLISGSDAFRQEVNRNIDKLQLAALSSEKDFLRGVRDFNTSTNDESFFRLSQENTSFFARAATGFPESWYWFGWVQFVANTGNSRNQFEKFLSSISSQRADARMAYLREDAKYRSFLIRFDENAGKNRAMRRLLRDIQAFSPENDLVREETDLLLKLVKVSLGEQIWGNIVPQSSRSVMFKKVFILIRQMMIRATRVTGKERVPYLDCLDKLFEITMERRKNETSFYQGMYYFLKAEIQETSEEKRRYYLQASDILENVSGDFVAEGNYIKARSIFAAAKHEPNARNMQRMYERAKPVFVDLVNNSKSLRSLFYLGEIFRISGNGLAAKSCYRVVVQKTKGTPRAAFWYNNARAGLQSSAATGDSSLLGGIAVNNVVFPERLLVIDDEEISLERFADPGYVRSLYRSDALELLRKFGPAKLDLYPSYTRAAGSIVVKRAFPGISAGIREKVGQISSGLKLVVLLPPGVTAPTDVTVDGQSIEPNADGVYEKSPVMLSSTAEIKVRNSRCYPYIEQHKFMKPGSEEVVVSLLPYISFKPGGEGVDQGVHVVNLTERLDNCMLVKTGDIVPDGNSLLAQAFKADIDFRDFDYSPVLNKFLAVKGDVTSLVQFRNDSKISREGEFALSYAGGAERLTSPESIVIDEKGVMYIVDWEKHRVFRFSSRGQYMESFGGLGENRPGSTGQQARFVFPANIAIARDTEGIMHNGRRIFRNPVLFVGDKYGIHMVTASGIYWDTVKLPQTDDATACTIAVKGYGLNMRLYLANKKTGKIQKYNAVLRR